MSVLLVHEEEKKWMIENGCWDDRHFTTYQKIEIPREANPLRKRKLMSQIRNLQIGQVVFSVSLKLKGDVLTAKELRQLEDLKLKKIFKLEVDIAKTATHYSVHGGVAKVWLHAMEKMNVLTEYVNQVGEL